MLDEAYDAISLGRAIRPRSRNGLTCRARPTCPWSREARCRITVAMRALAILGAKVVIAPKGMIVDEADPM